MGAVIPRIIWFFKRIHMVIGEELVINVQNKFTIFILNVLGRTRYFQINPKIWKLHLKNAFNIFGIW